MAQPDDHPPAGGLLHHLLTLTLTTPDWTNGISESGYFLLPTPTVTNSFFLNRTIYKHHLLTLTLTTPLKEQDSKSGYFLLPTPTVTNSFYFRKWDALCCPDFPPASPSRNASDRPERCFLSAKVQKTFESLLCFFTFFQY